MNCTSTCPKGLNPAKAIAETKKNGVFVLPGLGRLKKVERKARMGRNPATGKEMLIQPRRVVTFKCSRKLRQSVNPNTG